MEIDPSEAVIVQWVARQVVDALSYEVENALARKLVQQADDYRDQGMRWEADALELFARGMAAHRHGLDIEEVGICRSGT